MRLLAFVMVSASIAGCSDAGTKTANGSASPEATQDRQLIEDAFDRWILAYETGDPDEVASLFTDEAIYAANTGDVLKGRAQIKAGVAAWMQGSSRVGQQRGQARLDLQRQSLRLVQHGSFAHDLARFTIAINPPGCLIDSGHALAVWEKQDDGRWLIDALTVNQDKQQPENACRS